MTGDTTLQFPSVEFDDTVAGVCHGTATDEQVRALAKVLRVDSRARDEYLWQVELHARIATHDSLASDHLHPLGAVGGVDGVDIRTGARIGTWASMALVALALLGAVVIVDRLGRVGATKAPAERAGGLLADSGGQSRLAPMVAAFSEVQGARWVSPDSAHAVGDVVCAGQRIELASGSVRMAFTSGASVRLTGPAIFEAESPTAAILTMGRIAVTADTPESKGFTVRTRTGRIVDLGTEFTAEALPDGRCRIGVSSGVVSFHPGNRAAGQLLRAGDLMEIEPDHRQVITRIERGDESSAFRFPSIESPSTDDFADSSRGKTSIRCARGRLYNYPPAKAASAPPEILIDGRGQSNPDSPSESLYFAHGETGCLILDLGATVAVAKVNVFSWHLCLDSGFKKPLREAHRERATQKYTLYGSADEKPPSIDGELSEAGWTLLARVNSDDYFGLTGIERPAQQASSVTSARGALGRYRHLLFVVQPTTGLDSDGGMSGFGTFFGEIDVYAE